MNDYDFRIGSHQTNSEGLSGEAGAVDPNRIGLWGTDSSGKTTFLAVLYHALLESDEWEISTNSDETEDFILDMHETIFTNRVFPPPTPEDAVNVLHYNLSREIGPDAVEEFSLSFIDTGSPQFHNPRKWKAEHSGEESPLDILKTCGKIICLLDAEPFLPSRTVPASREDRKPVSIDEYFKDFYYLFYELVSQDRRRGKLKDGRATSYKIAFCLSKCDLPLIWEQRNNVRPFAERIFGKRVVAMINNYIHPNDYIWCAFSAVGSYGGGLQQGVASC